VLVAETETMDEATCGLSMAYFYRNKWNEWTLDTV